MKDKIELDVVYPHSPEEVWSALTEPAALQAWLMPADFKPLIGFRFRFERADGDPVTGKVIEVEEQKLLACTWDDGESPEPSVVVWRVDPTEGGTRVQLEHRYVETPEVTRLPIDAYFNWRYALHHSLPGLLQLLRGGVARPPMLYVSSSGTPESGDADKTSALKRIGFRQEVLL